MKLLRMPAPLERTGDRRSAFYGAIKAGLMVRPLKLSARAAAWPEHEIDAIVRARIAGVARDELAQLVEALHAKRSEHRAVLDLVEGVQ